MTPQPRSLLDAPEEIRLLIYEAYATQPGGLWYDYDSGKLRRADNAPVDMALMRTCKFVASEMEGVLLRVNTVNFKTCFTEMQRGRDKAWRAGLDLLDSIRYFIFMSSSTSLYATNALEAVSARYPHFRTRLSYFMANLTRFDPLFPTSHLHETKATILGRARLCREEIVFSLRHASTAGDQFRDDANEVLESELESVREHLLYNHTGHTNLMAKLDLTRLDPVAVVQFEERRWIIPTDDDIAELWSIMGGAPHPPKERWAGQGRLSAVYCAVRFLESLPDSVRAHLRQVSVVEDRFGLHADYMRALIPHCLANPRLHINRQFNVWSNLFTRAGVRWPGSSYICSVLTAEARLFELGMPNDSYSVSLHAEQEPDQAKRLFEEHVLRDVCYSRAYLEWEAQQQVRPPVLIGPEWEMHLDILEQALASMASGQGPFQCDFDYRQSLTAQEILDQIKALPPPPPVSTSSTIREVDRDLSKSTRICFGRHAAHRNCVPWSGVFYTRQPLPTWPELHASVDEDTVALDKQQDLDELWEDNPEAAFLHMTPDMSEASHESDTSSDESSGEDSDVPVSWW